MALTHFSKTIWSARLFENLVTQSVYMGLCNNDWEADASGAAKVKIGSLSGSTTIRDYTKDVAIESPELLTSSEQELNLDQQKYFNFYVDDVDKIQSNPDLMDAGMRQAGRAIAAVVDQYIANLMSAATVAGAIETVAARTSVATLASLSKGVNRLRKQNVPTDAARWIVMQPDDYTSLEDGLTNQASEAKQNMYLPGTSEEILRSGYAGNYKGHRVHMTTRRITSGNIANAGNAKSEIIFGTVAGCVFAWQWRNVEAYRPQLAFGDAVKGLFIYGAKVLDATQYAGAKVG